MRAVTYLSNFMIPFLLFYIIGYGLLCKRDIYSDFLEGAKEGLNTAIGILPTLIGLMAGVGVLRASGFLGLMGDFLGKITGHLGIPSQLVPLTVVRMFSSSAATGLLLDIFKEWGTDSVSGLMAAIIMSATESVFYCMSVYYGSVKIEKTRYTLAGALLATAAGVTAAVCIVNLLY